MKQFYQNKLALRAGQVGFDLNDYVKNSEWEVIAKIERSSTI